MGGTPGIELGGDGGGRHATPAPKAHDTRTTAHAQTRPTYALTVATVARRRRRALTGRVCYGTTGGVRHGCRDDGSAGREIERAHGLAHNTSHSNSKNPPIGGVPGRGLHRCTAPCMHRTADRVYKHYSRLEGRIPRPCRGASLPATTCHDLRNGPSPRNTHPCRLPALPNRRCTAPPTQKISRRVKQSPMRRAHALRGAER